MSHTKKISLSLTHTLFQSLSLSLCFSFSYPLSNTLSHSRSLCLSLFLFLSYTHSLTLALSVCLSLSLSLSHTHTHVLMLVTEDKKGETWYPFYGNWIFCCFPPIFKNVGKYLLLSFLIVYYYFIKCIFIYQIINGIRLLVKSSNCEKN